MSELFSYASEPGGVWSDLAAEIHTAVWDGVGLEKVQGFVRQWAKDWNGRRDEANKQAQDDFERTGKGVPEIAHCSFDGGFCRFPNPCECSRVMILPALPCSPDDPELPLPPDHDSRSLAEKWASLAAIHDVYRIDGDKINLWPVPADFHDVSVPADEHFLERAKQWGVEGSCYWRLIERAKRLAEGHKPVIEQWLKEVTTKNKATHSPDFRGVNWFGCEYSFTPNQAPVVKILWECWDKGNPDVGDQYLIEAVDSNSRRLDLVFRGHAAWGTMIVPGKTKGTRRLVAPEA